MSGPRIVRDFALHRLTPDEEATCLSMVEREPTARLLVMPTHHVDEFGDIGGFRFDCGAAAPGSSLPISRRMFFGHTLAECQDGEDGILRLMLDPAANRAAMGRFLEGVERDCRGALLDCIPDNSDALTGAGLLQVGFFFFFFLRGRKKARS